jgi:hypothetical protein
MTVSCATAAVLSRRLSAVADTAACQCHEYRIGTRCPCLPIEKSPFARVRTAFSKRRSARAP